MKMFGFILMTLAVASAEVIFDGACPAVQPVKDFDLSAYAGTWYHIKKLPLAHDGSGQCGKAFYTLDGDSLKLKYSQVINDVEVFVLGVANRADDANNAAKLVLNINVEKIIRRESLWIVATDYNNYAISYDCKYDEKSNTHRLNLWVLSRTKSLEGEAKVAVNAFMSSNFGYVDSSKFIMIDLSENACKFHSSHVYFANDVN